MTHARVLAGRLADLLRREQDAMAEFLVALADFDKRRGWLELGHSSLFYFLHRELGLSKGAAHYRKTAAELVQKFPEIVEALRDGRLCITSIVPLARVLTPENRREMLPKFFQRSKREAMAVAAALQPASAPHRDVVTALRPGGPRRRMLLRRRLGLRLGRSRPRGRQFNRLNRVRLQPPWCPSPPDETRPSRSPRTCHGSTSPSPGGSSRSCKQRALRFRTPVRAQARRRSWKRAWIWS